MGNPSVEKLGLFKRVFNLLDSPTTKQAGYDAVEAGMKSKYKRMDDINDAYKRYISNKSSKKIKNDALNDLKKLGFKKSDDVPIGEQLTAFQQKAKDNLPDMKSFAEDKKDFLFKNPKHIPQFALGAGKDYFTNGNAKQLAARYGAAAGIYATGAGLTRYVSGGSLSRNSSGDKDIAGIPFI